MSSLEEQTIERAQREKELDESQKPSKVTQVNKPNWKYAFKRAISEFLSDGCTDLAAALTYFAVLSIFPGLLAIVSLLGVFGQGEQTAQAILDLLAGFAPADVMSLIEEPITQLTSSSAAGLALVTGILGSLWTASGYVGAFGRALNRIYNVAEGRPIWVLRPLMLLVTAVLVLVVVLMMGVLVMSEGVINFISGLVPSLDLSGFAAVWAWLRYPVILVLAVVLIALLYYGTPNIKQPKLRWISPGALIALITMGIAGLGFSFYVANFGNYNATYGAIGGVIVGLLFLWIMNNVLLFGAEIDAELERSRELQAGIKAEEDIQLPPRSDAQTQKVLEKKEKLVDEGRDLRLKNNGVDFSAMAEEKENTSSKAAK